MAQKGTILIIGGAEDKGGDKTEMQAENRSYERFEILRESIPGNSRGGKIEIITSASGVPEQISKTYRAAFKKIGFTNLDFISVQDKPSARDPQYCKRIMKAHSVFFSGGDQFKLATTLGGTCMVDAIRDRYQHDENFVLAGTSAGAMAMSHIMIYQGGVHEAILKDDLRLTSGLGLMDGCIVDTHFIKRGRFGRLAHAVAMNPGDLGIGLGEDTALIIRKGSEAECRGSGMVVIIDGSSIRQTNITSIDDGSPVSVENLTVHVLAKGCGFSLPERRMTYTKPKTNKG
jgi:cyanophycinase